MDEKVCALVRDIKPLYDQDQASTETMNYVHAHLQECEGCRTYYEADSKENKLQNQSTVMKAKEPDVEKEEESKALISLAARLRRRRRRIIVGVTAGVLVLLCIFTQIIQTQIIGSDSMAPTYEAQDAVLVNRLAYTFSSPKRGDIIVYAHQEMSGIKRIIGLPGETVMISNGEILINGEKLVANYLSDRTIKLGSSENPMTLGENEYFVLGDNDVMSLDSRDRSFGAITKDEITGKVIGKGLSLFSGVRTEQSSAHTPAE